jgi:GT2 family glycosyltransferase
MRHQLPDGRFVVPGNRWDLVPDEPTTPPEISVVIPYFENQGGLDRLLAALAVQTHPQVRTQVIVADDGSTRPPVVGPEVLVVRQEDRGFRAAAARNLGAARADGQVLAFLDGDTIPDPHYLQRIGRLPALLPDALVGGHRRHVDLQRWTPAAVLDWLSGSGAAPTELTEPAWLSEEYRRSGDLLRAHPRSYRYLISATLACDREFFDEIGGFDGSMVGYGGEDWDLAFRAYTAGAVLAHEPRATVWHDGPDWGDRSASDPHARHAKNIETLELARRVTEPGIRGMDGLFTIPDVVVRLLVDGWTLGAVVLTARSWASRLDARVELVGADAVEIASLIGDPRVSAATPVGPARAVVTVTAPLVATERTSTAIADTLEQDRGLLTAAAGRVTVVSARARHRARRWAAALRQDEDALARELFGVVEEADAGLSEVIGDPSLAAVFGGWADPAGYLRSS